MLNSLQEKLLGLLKWFDGFCRKENLRYYIIGGTCIGAARHQGFIPWDDDADVGMPRSDYEKLVSLFEERENSIIDGFMLETGKSDAKDFYYTFGKLYDTTTTMTEKTRFNCRRGVYIDVFPLDGMGDTREESLKHFSKIDRKNMFLMTRVCAVEKRRSFYKNAAIVLSRLIPPFIVNDKKLVRKIDEMSAEKDFDKCNYVCNTASTYRSREIMERRIFGTPTEYPFEGEMLYGPENYDEYLTTLYGNWRELPPKEKQVAHHDFIELDLEKSFLTDKREA